MSDDRMSAIRRIKALLETAGRTEAEIDACSAKVQELLVKYHLSMSDLGQNNDPVIGDNDFLTDRATWIMPLLGAVARLYFCGHYTETFPADFVKRQGLHYNNHRLYGGDRNRVYLRHNFIGKQADIVVAKWFGQYLIDAMHTMCRIEEKKWPRNERSAFRLAFMNSCTARLRYRMIQKRQQATTSGITGTNLPAVQSLYQQAQDAAQSWLEQQGISPRQKKTSLANISHQGGSLAGWKAGEEIGLEQQIGDPRTTRRIDRH